MKKITIIISAVLLLSITHVSAQRALELVWTSDAVFQFAEGVIPSKTDNNLYVANTWGNPLERDGRGAVSKVTRDGKMIEFEWNKDLNAPKDIEIYNNRMYVADLDELVVIDINSKKTIKKIKIEGTRLLHNVSIDQNGIVYVGDMFGGKIYRVENDIPTLYLENLPGVAGLLAENTDLYFLSAGKMLKADKSKNITTIAEGMNQQVCSLVRINDKEFIVSCWVGLVYYINADGSTQLLLDTQKEQIPTGLMYYDNAKNMLYMTNDGLNTLRAYKVK